MFDEFLKWWDKLDGMQRFALSRTRYRYEPGVVIRDTDNHKIHLKLPKGFATFEKENYEKEIAFIDTELGDDYDTKATLKSLYNINFMVKHLDCIPESSYESQIKHIFDNLRSKDYYNLHLVTTYDQYIKMIKVLSSNITGNYDINMLQLLCMEDADNFDIVKDLDLSCLQEWKYIFYTKEQLKEKMITDYSVLDDLEYCIRNSDYYVDEETRNKYRDIAKDIKDNIFMCETEVDFKLRDSYITYKYANTYLTRFIAEILPIDIQFGRLIYGIMKRKYQYSSFQMKVDTNEIINMYKCNREMTAEEEYLGRQLTYEENQSRRYNSIVSQMFFVARCCILREIPKSKRGIMGNALALVEMFNYDWDMTFSALYGNLKNEDI